MRLDQLGQIVSPLPGGGLIAADAPDSYLGPPDEHGLRHPVSLATVPTADGFPSEWHRQRYLSDLRRELLGVEHRLAHLDGPLLAWQEPPTRESIERQRVSLEGTREAILAELARLDPQPAKEEQNHGRKAKAA